MTRTNKAKMGEKSITKVNGLLLMLNDTHTFNGVAVLRIHAITLCMRLHAHSYNRPCHVIVKENQENKQTNTQNKIKL